MTEPREVHGDLDTEVFTNVVQGLGAKERADPCSLQLLQRRQFVEREDLQENSLLTNRTITADQYRILLQEAELKIFKIGLNLSAIKLP